MSKVSLKKYAFGLPVEHLKGGLGGPQGHPQVPKCPLCMAGHATTSSNTTMNRLPAQHHIDPPPKAPRGAS
eukprot:3531199-Prymnesium_polylepis.1